MRRGAGRCVATASPAGQGAHSCRPAAGPVRYDDDAARRPTTSSSRWRSGCSATLWPTSWPGRTPEASSACCVAPAAVRRASCRPSAGGRSRGQAPEPLCYKHESARGGRERPLFPTLDMMLLASQARSRVHGTRARAAPTARRADLMAETAPKSHRPEAATRRLHDVDAPRSGEGATAALDRAGLRRVMAQLKALARPRCRRASARRWSRCCATAACTCTPNSRAATRQAAARRRARAEAAEQAIAMWQRSGTISIA